MIPLLYVTASRWALFRCRAITPSLLLPSPLHSEACAKRPSPWAAGHLRCSIGNSHNCYKRLLPPGLVRKLPSFHPGPHMGVEPELGAPSPRPEDVETGSRPLTARAETLIAIDGEVHDLRSPPARCSAILQAAQSQIDIDLPTYARDLSSLAERVRINHAIAQRDGFDGLSNASRALCSTIESVCRQSGTMVRDMHATAISVLAELPENVDALRFGQIDNAVRRLSLNDSRVEDLASTAERLSHALDDAVRQTEETLAEAVVHRQECEQRQRELREKLDQLDDTKAAAFEAHSLVLETLNETGKEYVQALRRERAAKRRTTLYSSLGWLSTLDTTLQTHFSVTALQPVSQLLQSVGETADAATAEKDAILRHKVEQRKVYGECVTSWAESAKYLRDVASELESVGRTVDALERSGAELGRLAVVIGKLAHFFRQVGTSTDRLSAGRVLKLVEVLRPTQATQALEEGEALDVSGVSRHANWDIPTALKRRLVSHYAQWSAYREAFCACVEVMESL